MENPGLDPGFIIGLILIGIVFAYILYGKDRNHITEYLYQKGCSVVEISKVWFEADRSNNVYRVVYQDSQNRIHRTKCKVQSFLFFTGEIYWYDGPFSGRV